MERHPEFRYTDKPGTGLPLPTGVQDGTITQTLTICEMWFWQYAGWMHSVAGQAWILLQQRGFDSYILQGGMNYWVQAFLNPTPPGDIAADEDILEYQFRKGAAVYFTGGGVVSTQTTETQKTNPTTIKKFERRKRAPKGGPVSNCV